MDIISVTHQGAPIVHTDSVIEKVCGDIATLTIDMGSKYCEIVAYSDEDRCPVIVVCAGEFALHLSKVTDRDQSTDIKITKYSGWRLFVADIVRYTLRVCLVKEDNHEKDEEDQEHNDV